MFLHNNGDQKNHMFYPCNVNTFGKVALNEKLLAMMNGGEKYA
jgi:hypothetical protein